MGIAPYESYFMNYVNCKLCPRGCGANRAAGELGYCQAPDTALIAKSMLHKWEEPALAGNGGSGAVFFGNCTLGCIYCQNRKISKAAVGTLMDTRALRKLFENLIAQSAENIDLVTPTHFLPTVAQALNDIRALENEAVDVKVRMSVLENAKNTDTDKNSSALGELAEYRRISETLGAQCETKERTVAGYDAETGKLLVSVNPKWFRPTDVDNLWGDPTKAKTVLGWNPQKTSYAQLVEIMAKHDRQLAKREKAMKEAK